MRLAIESIEAIKDLYFGRNQSPANFENQRFNNIGRGYNGNDQTQSVEYLLDDLEKNKEGFKAFLGESYAEFDKIIEGLKKGMVWNQYLTDGVVQHSIYREQIMYKNMMDYLKEKPTAKVFGQFGRCHIGDSSRFDDCYFQSFRAFAQRLKESQEFDLADKVFPIPIIYAAVGSYGYYNSYWYEGNTTTNTGFRDKAIIKWYKGYLDKGSTGVHLLELEEVDDSVTVFVGDGSEPIGLDYDFVIFDLLTTYGTAANVNGVGRKGSKNDYYSYYHFEAAYTLQGYNLNSLNDAVSQFGLNKYDGNTFAYSASFIGYEPGYIYAGVTGSWWEHETQSTDSLSLDFSGMSFIGHIGGALVDHKHF
ncbi:MAG: hypothetical protein JKY54_13270, partial [Flavobacteriales bacterium]|nr:hypothetical protein [Flavobacteriales bacterium]